MENDIAEQIEKRLAELPEDVRNAVMSVEWEQKVQAIAQKHALHIDQSGVLGDVTLMAMLGFFDIADYPAHIAQEVGVPAEKASLIAADISNEVFTSIRGSLRAFTETKKSIPEAAKPDLLVANAVLQAKTVSLPAQASTPATPPKPANYAADPYREPPL